MATPIEMPKLSDTMEEGVLSAWLADEGDAVSAGDVIAQVETDKATMDLEVYDDGVLLKRVVDEGANVPLGALIAVLGEEDEDIADVLAEYDAGGGGAAADTRDTDEAEEATDEAEEKEASAEGEEADAEKQEAAESEGGEEDEAAEDEEAQVTASDEAETQGAEQEDAKEQAASENGRVKASPLARRMAQEEGLDLAAIDGSGPQGRVVKRDVEAALEEGGAQTKEAAPSGDGQREGEPYQMPSQVAPDGEELYEAEPISQMRKTIARRLAESKYTAPHFYLTVDIDMAPAADFRKELNELSEKRDGPRISFNDLITKACAAALRDHPQVNASYLEKEGEIRFHTPVHVAVAVAVDEGLLTPVIRNADQKGLGQISKETRALAEKARDKKLQPEDYEGSTFTTSNLGMFGIEEFTAIINPPNACILAIGAVRDEPVVEGREVVPGKRMRVTLSCDHRVVDGATGAQFLSDVKEFLEEPKSLLL